MKIKRFPLNRMTIDDFAEKHSLVMEIHELDACRNRSSRYYAHFSRVEVMLNGMLESKVGYGNSEDEAIEAYAYAISGRKIVLNAYGNDRQEIDVPILIDR
jgi:hypothetical protein